MNKYIVIESTYSSGSRRTVLTSWFPSIEPLLACRDHDDCHGIWYSMPDEVNREFHVVLASGAAAPHPVERMLATVKRSYMIDPYNYWLAREYVPMTEEVS